MLNRLPQIKILSNGFKIICIENKNIRTVALNLRGLVGSNYEAENEIGVAHFLEHVLLANAEKQLIYDVGGKIVSSTSREDVFYYVKLLDSDIERGLAFLAQIFRQPHAQESELVTQKEIIRQEIKRAVDNPEKYIFRLAYKLLYPNARPEKLNTGGIDDVQKIDTDNLKTFFQKNYIAQNFALAVCGDIRSDRIFKHAEKYFSKIDSNPRQNFKPFKQDVEFRVQVENRNQISQSHLLASFYGFPRFSKESYVLKYISQTLAGESISILPNIIRTGKGFAYKVLASSFSSTHINGFGIYTACEEKNVQDVLILIKKALHYYSHKLIDEYIFSRAKNSLVADLIFSFERPSVIANFYSDIALSDRHAYTHQDELDMLTSITKEDILETAQKLFAQEPKLTVITPTLTKSEIEKFWQD